VSIQYGFEEAAPLVGRPAFVARDAGRWGEAVKGGVIDARRFAGQDPGAGVHDVPSCGPTRRPSQICWNGAVGKVICSLFGFWFQLLGGAPPVIGSNRRDIVIPSV